jgi:DNA-binding XRE family transcriptional regulator
MGDPFVVNRKTQTQRIREPFVDVAGGLQPDMINLFAKENRDRNGFLVRFCNIYPDKADKPFYNDKFIPEHVRQQYFEYIRNLLALQYNPDSNEYIYLSDEAHSIYISWFNKNASAINQEKYDYLRGVYSKLDIISLRLALTIHFSKWALTNVNENKITPETMKAALDITEYFRITGTKVFQNLQIPEEKVLSNKEVAQYLSSLGNSQNQIAEVMKCSQQNVQRFLKNNQ